MFTTSVTIGRNIGTEPMSDSRWADFRSDVLDVIRAKGYEPLFDTCDVYLTTSLGRGFWDGYPEDNCTITLLHKNEISPENWESLRSSLRVQCARYRQGGIALLGQVRADLLLPL